jgi:hypothetical protein
VISDLAARSRGSARATASAWQAAVVQRLEAIQPVGPPVEEAATDKQEALLDPQVARDKAGQLAAQAAILWERPAAQVALDPILRERQVAQVAVNQQAEWAAQQWALMVARVVRRAGNRLGCFSVHPQRRQVRLGGQRKKGARRPPDAATTGACQAPKAATRL